MIVQRLRGPLVFTATLMLISGTGHSAETTCIDVEVNGIRTPSIECLNQQLSQTTQKKGTETVPMLKSEQVTQMPSNQLGLFNRAATSISMGNNFGKSAFPQRPK